MSNQAPRPIISSVRKIRLETRVCIARIPFAGYRNKSITMYKDKPAITYNPVIPRIILLKENSSFLVLYTVSKVEQTSSRIFFYIYLLIFLKKVIFYFCCEQKIIITEYRIRSFHWFLYFCTLIHLHTTGK